MPLEVLTQVEVSELAEPGKRRQVAANTETARPPKVEVSYSNDPGRLAAAIEKVKAEGGEEAVVAAVNSVDQTLRTPLHHAVNDVNPGSWLNRNRDRDGRAEAMVQCTEILLSAGAQPAGQDKFGYTAAHLAAWAGTNRAEPLALLAAAAAGPDGADLAAAKELLTSKNRDGDSPLASARRGCRKQMIALCERADDEANLAEDLAPHIERLKKGM
eukprot:COSAG04_NODE_7889_length_1051_cov_1.275210_1_plen_214_part_01